MPAPPRHRAIRVVAAVVWLVTVALPATAESGDDSPPLVDGTHRLEYVSGSAAVSEIAVLLTARGSIVLLDGGRTVVVRDVEATVERALERLAAFDRPGRSVRVQVQIVSAGATPGATSPESTIELPEEVLERLRSMLRYRAYALVARAELEAREETASSYEVGSDYRVSLRLDRRGTAPQVWIRDFRVLRRTPDGELKPLVETDLNLEMGRPMILGLSQTESSERALMVVLQCDETVGAASEARG